MRTWKFKSWRSASLAALTLAACSPSSDEPAQPDATTPAPGEADEAMPAGGESGESGEAGATSAYAGLTGDDLTALRLEHLKGYLMIAQRVADTGAGDDAAILVAQGVLEAYDAAPTEFGGLDIAPVRAVGEAIGQPVAEIKQRIAAALTAIEAVRTPLHAHEATVTARLIDIATGLYQSVVRAGDVDAIEYQHSFGAALAARDALENGRDVLRQRNRHAYDDAKTEMDRFVALWPTPAAPPTPATYGQVLAQGSRVRLALSPYL